MMMRMMRMMMFVSQRWLWSLCYSADKKWAYAMWRRGGGPYLSLDSPLAFGFFWRICSALLIPQTINM
jgi:hypothetical protein